MSSPIELLEPRRLFGAAIPQRILFIRGGSGTGGFLEGGSDEQLADITNFQTFTGNHGWGQLADALRAAGFTPEQMIEGPAANNTPVDLAGFELSAYRAVVFGSNNADYGPAQVDALEQFIRNTGGGALFISDANFGRNWRDAADSDQAFLSRFGLVMNQDLGVYALDRAAGDFVVPDHPIFAGVDVIDGEGVSPIVLSGTAPAGVVRQRLAVAKHQTRNNDGTDPGNLFLGLARNVTPQDSTTAIAAAGAGRLAGHFDRNTFFNLNGAGTSLVRFDNRQYAINLFRWLAFGDPEGVAPQLTAAGFDVDAASAPAVRLTFSEDVSPSLHVSDFTVTHLGTGAVIPASGLDLRWDRATNALAISLLNPLALADGDYRLSASAGDIADPFGNSLTLPLNFDFFVLAGDASRDRRVDLADFSILASNYNAPGVFSDGDFDYSGSVGIGDFAILAGRYNSGLAPALFEFGQVSAAATPRAGDWTTARHPPASEVVRAVRLIETDSMDSDNPARA
jgi:hypothetical protein